MSEMQTQLENDIQGSIEDLDGLKASIEFVEHRLDRISQPVRKLTSALEGSIVEKDRFHTLLEFVSKGLIKTLVHNVIDDLRTCSPEYVEGERADEICAWQEIRYLIHHIDYSYENDFLYSLSKRVVENSYEFLNQDFSDGGMAQYRMAEQIFDVINGQTSKLKSYEKAIIWGLNDDYEGVSWMYSEDEVDELMWEDDFIENHIYHLILDKAQDTPVTSNIENFSV